MMLSTPSREGSPIIRARGGQMTTLVRAMVQTRRTIMAVEQSRKCHL